MLDWGVGSTKVSSITFVLVYYGTSAPPASMGVQWTPIPLRVITPTQMMSRTMMNSHMTFVAFITGAFL